MKTIYDFTVKDAQGNEIPLSTYEGKIILIVNTASKCGFTPQYDDLEKLYQDLKEQGLIILGFPCNQFGNQEPGTNDDIQTFCRINHGVTFPVLAKIDVNGPDTHPLFKYLKHEAPGFAGSEAIKWNFTKFLIDRNGNVVARFASATSPNSIKKKILPLL